MEDLCRAIHLWDVATGELKPEPEGHSTSWFRPPAFSPDGKRVATSGGMDGTIRVWEMASGRQLALLRRSPSSVLDCAISADGRTLVSCWDDRVLLSDAATGRVLHVLEANDWRRLNQHPNMSIRRGSFTNDWLMTCWDTTARKQLFRRQLAYHGSEREIAVSPDATVLALPGTMREPMRLEDVETGERLLTFPILKRSDKPLAFSADGRLLLSHALTPVPPPARGSTQTLHLWEVLTTSELLASPIPISSHEAAVSADGRLLAAISPQREILLWDLKRDKELHRFKDFGSGVNSLVFSPDSRRLVSCLYDSTLLVWDAAAGRSKDRPTALDAPGTTSPPMPAKPSLRAGCWQPRRTKRYPCCASV
jgi:WD40 repeat protein